MTFDLLGMVQLPPALVSIAKSPEGREKLQAVASCFDAHPDVLQWIGLLSGVHQPVAEPNDEGKRVLFLEILAMIALGGLTDEQIDKL